MRMSKLNEIIYTTTISSTADLDNQEFKNY